jgi:choline kinase
MIAVILAAGMSTRLRPLTNNLPKCLLKVGETTILSRYLDLLEQAGVRKTIIVYGFMHHLIENEVASKKRAMIVEYILNDHYSTSHPIHSFLLAEKTIDDDFLLLNADLYFSINVLSALIKAPHSCVAIDSKAAYVENEMFVNFNDVMEVTEISKSLTKHDHSQGKSVQLTKFILSDKDALFKRAKELSEQTNSFYPAQAYDTLITKKRFCAIDVAGEFTHELDTVEDYDSLLLRIELG